MTYYLLLIQLLFAVVGLFLFWQSVGYFRQMWRYKKFKAMPFPKSCESILQEIHQYNVLSPTHKEKIHLLILTFIDEKEFIGVKMTITQRNKVIIAFYACLMRLGFELGEKDDVSTIIVYPKHFIINDSRAAGGIYHDETSVLEGQSANGTVVISWQDIEQNITQQQKDNVIIHEFAHELDFEDGYSDGTPVLEDGHYKTWSKVFTQVFDALKADLNNEEVSEKAVLLGRYALKNEAEFFAVCSERFFETPHAFKAHFSDIYDELTLFYKLDTQQLFKGL